MSLLGIEEKLRIALDFHQRGQSAQAEALYRDVLLQAPAQFEALHLLGLLYFQNGRHDEAAALINKSVSIKPDYLAALNNLGVVLTELKRYQEALACYDRVISLDPAHLDAVSNRGVVLKALLRYDEALAAYDLALSMQEDLADVHNNRGVVLQDIGRHDEALTSYARAIALNSNYAEAHWNDARCRLLLGDYVEGWKKYEWRWKRSGFTSPRRNFQQPLWLGNGSLAGKTILLHAEQGLGDTLQFLRYVPIVARLGARIVLEVQPALKPLLARFQGVDVLLAKGEALPPFDWHCPLLSLPLALGTTLQTIPAETPYLHADPDKLKYWEQRLGARRGLRIGIMWTGNPDQKDNHLRSVTLRDLLPLADAGIELISLQKELCSDDERAIVAAGTVRHFGESLEDTAALIGNLDLVISVCTSMAHLTGAMGKPLWVLLQYAHDWRWLLDREDSPWYPSARLYRQTKMGDWTGVIEQVKRDCAKLMSQQGSV